jgi:O-antigen/teichoic acid export membrane protein
MENAQVTGVAPVRRFVGRMTERGGLARLMSSQVIAVGIGLVVLGITSYGFLVVAARRLDAGQFAQLSVVWTALFTIGPGLFLPLEQSVAQRLAAGAAPDQLLRRAAALAVTLLVLLVALSLALAPFISRRLLDSDVALFWAMLLTNCALAPVHLSRGLLAGTGQFGAYGLQLGFDGAVRLLGSIVLAAAGVGSVTAYACVLIVSQLSATALSLAVAYRPVRQALSGRKPSATGTSWAGLASGLSWMLVAALAGQSLANGGTVVVKAFAKPGDPVAGHFLTAVVLTRLPLFLFAALQASLLPLLARRIAEGDVRGAAAGVRRLLAILSLVGAAASVLLLLAGPQLDALVFGSQFRVARLPMVILSVASTLYILAAGLGQALLALESAAQVAVGWVLGTAVFLLALVLPGSLEVRVSNAFLLGAGVTFAGFLASAGFRFHQRGVALIRRPAGAMSG